MISTRQLISTIRNWYLCLSDIYKYTSILVLNNWKILIRIFLKKHELIACTLCKHGLSLGCFLVKLGESKFLTKVHKILRTVLIAIQIIIVPKILNYNVFFLYHKLCIYYLCTHVQDMLCPRNKIRYRFQFARKYIFWNCTCNLL